MTIQQMHRSFKLELDKIDSLQYPDLLPAEIDVILNNSQERFIKTRYSTNNIYRTGFEVTDKRISDLQFVLKDFYRPIVMGDYNSFLSTYSIPFSEISDYWFRDREMVERVNLNTDCIPYSTKILKVKFVQGDDYTQIKQDPFNKPELNFPVSLFSKNIELDFGQTIDFTSTQMIYKLRYIKKPLQVHLSTPQNPAVSVDCELQDETHQEIVDIAVKITLEAIESQRFQTNSALIKEQE